jgi:TonB family protein
MFKAGETLQGRIVDGKFRLDRYLGGSERSAVFLTERPQGTPRAAAIKLIPADPVNADLQLSRWKLSSRLSHPHLLQVWEAGRCRQNGQDVLYVVMEYADETLAEVLPHRALTLDEAQQMLPPVLETLAHLHGRGFVHGHLKPSNILVAGEQLKLSSDRICRIGEMDGTQAGIYAAPELPGSVAAPEQDIWSLGVLVAQALTQLLPVRNGSKENRVIVPETVPAQFASLVENCLQQDPRRRCTLEEIAEQVHCKLPARTLGPPALPAEPAAAQRLIPIRSARPATERKQSVLPAVAIILTLVAIVVAGGYFSRKQTQPEESAATLVVPPPAEPTSGTTASQRRSAPRATSAAKPAITLSAQSESSTRPGLKAASEVRAAAPTTSPRTPSPSNGVVPGTVLQQVLPDVPQSASNTIHGTVRVTVRVQVNPAGEVAAVDFISAGPSKYFARLSADAARQWKFSPALRGREAVASTWQMRFEFTRAGERAIPTATP